MQQAGATARESLAATWARKPSQVVSAIAAAAAVRKKGAKHAATTRLHAPCPVPSASYTARTIPRALSKLQDVVRLHTAAAAGERACASPTRAGPLVTSTLIQGGTTVTPTTLATAVALLGTGEATGEPLEPRIVNAFPSVGLSRTTSVRISVADAAEDATLSNHVHARLA